MQDSSRTTAEQETPLEALEFPKGLDHRAHVQLAWRELRARPVVEALANLSNWLRRYAASKGRAEAYSETLTWAFILLINERMARSQPETFSDFEEHNPDLFSGKQILERYYRKSTLESEIARKVFILPDLSGG